MICGIAVIVVFSSTLTILALASKAFAFYYALQCLVAFNVSKDRNQRIGIALVAAALGFITLFAVPAGLVEIPNSIKILQSDTIDMLLCPKYNGDPDGACFQNKGTLCPIPWRL